MGKVCAAIASLLLVVALAGCGGSATPTATAASKGAATAAPTAAAAGKTTTAAIPVATAAITSTAVAPTAAAVKTGTAVTGTVAAVTGTATIASTSGATWKIAVEGLGKEASFTNADLQKLGTVKVKAAMKDKESMGPEQEYTGVPLAKVLTSLGVTSYTTVKVEAGDGYFKEYTPDLVAADGTLLAIEVSGKALDKTEGPVELVVNGKGSNWWIKNVVKITVIK